MYTCPPGLGVISKSTQELRTHISGLHTLAPLTGWELLFGAGAPYSEPSSNSQAVRFSPPEAPRSCLPALLPRPRGRGPLHAMTQGDLWVVPISLAGWLGPALWGGAFPSYFVLYVYFSTSTSPPQPPKHSFTLSHLT